MGNGIVLPIEKSCGFQSNSGTVHFSISSTNDKARDRSVLIFSEVLEKGYCCTKTPTLNSLENKYNEVLSTYQSFYVSAQVVVVCLSPDTMNDINQVLEVNMAKMLKKKMLYVAVDPTCTPKSPGQDKLNEMVGADDWLLLESLKDRNDVTANIIKFVGNKCKKEPNAEPTHVFNTPDGDDKYWGTVNADGEKHGYGRCVYAKPVGREYIGDFTNGKRNGSTVIRYPNGNMFIGAYKMEKWHGKGIMIYSDGDTYEGGYCDGVRAGHGEFIKTDGEMYVGSFVDDKFGHGKYIWPDGGYYVGEFQNNAFHGEGTMYNADGTVEYSGQYVEDNEA